MKINRNYKTCDKCNRKIALSVYERHIKGKNCGRPAYQKIETDECFYCKKIIKNKGSLVAHIKTCDKNPNKIKFKHSSLAGRQKGCMTWNKGKTFDEKIMKEIIRQIENGEYKKFGESYIRRRIKSYLIHKHGHKCMICGLCEWQGIKIPLVADHIDGNSKNNEISNFRIICNNCDSILPTFKGKNKGNGRSFRYIKNKI